MPPQSPSEPNLLFLKKIWKRKSNLLFLVRILIDGENHMEKKFIFPYICVGDGNIFLRLGEEWKREERQGQLYERGANICFIQSTSSIMRTKRSSFPPGFELSTRHYCLHFLDLRVNWWYSFTSSKQHACRQ